MNVLKHRWVKLLLLVFGIVVVVAGIGALLRPEALTSWLTKAQAKASAKKDVAAELVPNGEEPTLRISRRVADALGIKPETIKKAVTPAYDRDLPPQVGTLAYDSDRLFAVRSRFAGEVSEVKTCPPDQRGSIPVNGRSSFKPKSLFPPYKVTPPLVDENREFSVGDRVEKGQLLAIVWSKDLGDKKAALIDAIIDLRRDSARLKDLEKLYFEGSVSAATYYEAQRTVKKDLSARNAAERTLRMWKAKEDKEMDALIDELKKEAETIDEEKRDAKKEKEWARVEIRALNSGVIVEKNTHVGDWVDPANYATPMFRVADLTKLQVWINPAEEYLPVLQDLLKNAGSTPVSWKIKLQADPKASSLSGAPVRIAPSLDYAQHTPLLVGIVDNPGAKLLVGQFVTATISVPVEKDLVEIPTNAVNEEKGQSVVFVQRDSKVPEKLEFTMRAVSVVRRFKDVVYVRSSPSEQPEELAPGALPIRALEVGDRVLTESVVELTKALRDLRAKEKLGKQKN